MKARITIGIPCFQGVDFQVLDDYMRFAFYLGRRYQEYEFFLAIKGKSEQFRARNSLVDQMLHTDSDYLLMLDDDHVIDFERDFEVDDSFEFLRKLLGHMEKDPKMGIVGALYSQRGREGVYPVVMQERDGIPYFLSPQEISNTMQEVAVTGGGCMLIRREVFLTFKRPWFEAEHEYGTDVQICRKAREAGFGVWCDTSIEIGHQLLEKEVILPSKIKAVFSDKSPEDLKKELEEAQHLDLYSDDVLDYTRKPLKALVNYADLYDVTDIEDFEGTKEEYYVSRGVKQLARNFVFNSSEQRVKEAMQIFRLLSPIKYSRGLDYCCGSAPIGFGLALRGKKMDFFDLNGASSYEFVKWRTKKHSIDAGFEVGGPYDFVLLMDALEHLENWEEHLIKIDSTLRDGAMLITNFFVLYNYTNTEHIFMNKYKVEGFLVDRGYLPMNHGVWVKGGKKNGKRSDFDAGSKDGSKER